MNNFSQSYVLHGVELVELRYIESNFKNDALVSGLITALINDRSDLSILDVKLSDAELDIPEDIRTRIKQSTQEILKDTAYSYALVESCLNGSTIINIH